MAFTKKIRLGDLLVEKGLITEDILQHFAALLIQFRKEAHEAVLRMLAWHRNCQATTPHFQ